MPTLTNVFEIKTVASSSFGFSSKCRIRWLDADLTDFIAFSWVGVSEKKAVSVADMAAEQANNNRTTRIWKNRLIVKVRLEGAIARISSVRKASGSGSVTMWTDC